MLKSIVECSSDEMRRVTDRRAAAFMYTALAGTTHLLVPCIYLHACSILLFCLLGTVYRRLDHSPPKNRPLDSIRSERVAALSSLAPMETPCNDVRMTELHLKDGDILVKEGQPMPALFL